MNSQGAKGFLYMTVSFVGVVLFSRIFLNIMEYIESIRSYTYVDSFLILALIAQILPTVLLISTLLLARWGYNQGEMKVAASDTGGLLRLVYGAIGLIIFLALFVVFLPYMYYIIDGGLTTNATYEVANYIALDTIGTIIPAILLLGGAFYTGRTAVRGGKAVRSRRRMKLA